MKIALYEKKRNALKSEFQPATNERLVWLINHISNVEEDKEETKFRIDALLSGRMINTNLSSFIIKIIE